MADTFIWYELMTSDQDAAIRFYTAVVGWNVDTQTMPEMGDFRYTILTPGKPGVRCRGVGGIMQINQEMKAHGAVPAWVGYVGVADADNTARAIAEAGGRVLMEPQDIPNVGRFAMVTDPGGAAFYIMTPFPQEDVPPAPSPNTPGYVGWHELYAGNGQEAAFAFYQTQFGWETLDQMDMGAMGKYRIFGAGGEAFGGMMDKPAQMPVSAWNFYFNIDGIDAARSRIEENGGAILMGPHEVPNGSWVVQATDPQGAHFALVSQTR